MSLMKNEKVALVFFSYIIGFTTAFIAFAINDNDYSKNYVANPKTQPESVNGGDKVQQNNSAIEVVEKPEGLFILNNGNERVLSAAASNGVSGEGFHTEIFSASVSSDGQYVHFCASLVGEPGLCTNFVYSIMDDLVYRVTVMEEVLKTTPEEAKEIAWVNENTLRFSEGWATAETNWSIR